MLRKASSWRSVEWDFHAARSDVAADFRPGPSYRRPPDHAYGQPYQSAQDGLTLEGAGQRVREAFDLPDVDLAKLDMIAGTVAGDPNAPDVLKASAKLCDTVTQASLAMPC